MAAEAADLQPYQAVYELKLSSAREGSSIIGLRGVFIVEWADICEGWTVAQDMRMEISTVERQRIVNDINFSSYETSDGENLRFTMRWTARDEPFQEYSGRAVRGGSATFVVPEGQSLALPADTLFPTTHLTRVVDAAAAGQPVFSSTVFSGSGPDSLHEVTAFIGAEIPAGSQSLTSGDQDGFQDLAALRSWPVSLAYFPATQSVAEPEFEVNYRLFENGVADDLLLDYGDFAMSGQLREVALSAKPDC